MGHYSTACMGVIEQPLTKVISSCHTLKGFFTHTTRTVTWRVFKFHLFRVHFTTNIASGTTIYAFCCRIKRVILTTATYRMGYNKVWLMSKLSTGRIVTITAFYTVITMTASLCTYPTFCFCDHFITLFTFHLFFNTTFKIEKNKFTTGLFSRCCPHVA